MHLAVKQGQPLPPVEGAGGHPQPLEVAHHVGLHTLQPGPVGGDPLGGNAESDVLGTLYAVVALGNLVFQHPHELAPDAVKIIFGHRDIDLIPTPCAGAPIDKGKLERQGAIKVIQERAPAAENGSLILSGRNGIIDVLVLDGFCVKVSGELAYPVRVHRHIGDGLLGRQRRLAFSGPCRDALFCLRFLQYVFPPFP